MSNPDCLTAAVKAAYQGPYETTTTTARRTLKINRLMSKTTTLHVHHAYLYISLQSLNNYDVK